MDISEHAGIALLINDEVVEARRRGEGSLHDQASRQEDEAALGFRNLVNFPFGAVFAGRLGGLLSGVVLIDIGQLGNPNA